MPFRAFVAALVLVAGPAHAPCPPPPDAAKGTILVGEITESALEPVLEQVHARVQAGDKRIMLRINSPGGSVQDGYAFIGALEDVRKGGVHIDCVVDSYAASMAFILLESSGCEQRIMLKRSFLLAHTAKVGLSGGGNSSDLEQVLEVLRALDAGFIDMVAARMHMPAAEVDAKIHGRDWTMGWRAALGYGAVDVVLDDGLTLPPAFGAPEHRKTLSEMLGL